MSNKEFKVGDWIEKPTPIGDPIRTDNQIFTSPIEQEVFIEQKKENKENQKPKTAYVIYICDGKKYIDDITYNIFESAITTNESIKYNNNRYHCITNSEIDLIEKKFNSVPGEIIFLETKNKYKINYDNKNINITELKNIVNKEKNQPIEHNFNETYFNNLEKELISNNINYFDFSNYIDEEKNTKNNIPKL